MPAPLQPVKGCPAGALFGLNSHEVAEPEPPVQSPWKLALAAWAAVSATRVMEDSARASKSPFLPSMNSLLFDTGGFVEPRPHALSGEALFLPVIALLHHLCPNRTQAFETGLISHNKGVMPLRPDRQKEGGEREVAPPWSRSERSRLHHEASRARLCSERLT